MTAQIPITGMTDNVWDPGEYIEIAFAQGSFSGSSQDRKILIASPKLSTGTYTVNVATRAHTETEVIAGLGGAGTPGHRMFRLLQKVNKTAEVYVLPYAETTGGSSAAAAVSTTTVAGPATSAGTATMEVCGETFTVAFEDTDTASAVAGYLRSMIAGATWLPVVVSGTDAAVTLTAKVKGIRGGTSTAKPIKIRASVTGTGITVTPAGDLGATTPGAEGTTTEAASLLTALNANTSVRYYYLVTDLGGDSAAMANVATWLASQAEPRSGMRGCCVAGYNLASAAAITIANSLNYERITIAQGLGTAHAPDEIAAQVAGIVQKRTATDASYNFDGYTSTDWVLKPSSLPTEWLDSGDRNDCILGGLTPISSRLGDTSLTTLITTRTLDSSGTYMDMRAAEMHRISSADWFGDLLVSTLAVNLRGSKLVADPLKSDGTVDWNAIAKWTGKKHSPATIKPMITKVIDDACDSNQADDSKKTDMKDGTQIVLATTPAGRVETGLPYFSINIYHQSTIYVAESTGG